MPRIGAKPDKYAYQKDGIRWLRGLGDQTVDPGRGLLADEPGLGKSRQLLMAAEGRTLVVAPSMVLDGGVWTEEHQKWRPDLDLTTAPYSMLNSREKTGKGSGTRPTENLRPEYLGHWDTVILDESHYIKGRKTSWTKAVQKLETDQLFCATGTPIPNWAYELFTTLQLLYPSEAKSGKKYGSYWRWAKLWFDCSPTQFSGGIPQVGEPLDDSDEGWARFHADNLGVRFLQRLRDDVLTDLPPMTVQDLYIPMLPAQRRIYNQLKKDYVAWTESGEELVAWSSGGLHVKLAQVCTGVELLDPSSPCSNKLDVLAVRLHDQAQPSLVACAFKATARAAAVRALDVGRRPAVIDGDTSSKDRKAAIEGYKAGRYDVLCATIETIAEGLTLTNADTVHMLERSYRPSKNEQVVRRVHRIGQLRPVTVLNYHSLDTVDQRSEKLLARKTDHQVKVLRAREFAALL